MGFAGKFYVGHWIRIIQGEIEKCMKAPMMSIPGAAANDTATDASDLSVENLQSLQEKKDFYRNLSTELTPSRIRLSKQKLSYRQAQIVAKYLASSGAFSHSFDIYLQQILRILNETSTALRTKAVKALTQIVSVDPNILGRDDVQTSVHGRFRDQSTNVREASVDLIGQFVLKCPDLTDRYYDMIMERILDTGISVRKRVIKILRDICIEQPEYPKIPEICLKIIRRINDEEGIKELVTKVFQKMWFSDAVNSSEREAEMTRRAKNITHVVALCKDTGYDWFESLLNNLFDSDDNGIRTTAEKTCLQIVDCLVGKLLKSEHQSGSQGLVSCLTTLYLFCKVRPELLVPHSTTLQPYLSMKCSTQGDALVIQNIARILERVVPLIEHPNPKFLAELEEDMMKLIIKQGQNIVQSCLSCLGSVINNVTHNFKFVIDCFKKFYAFLSKARIQHEKDPDSENLKATKPHLLRSLFIIGLLTKHFDLDKINETNKDITIDNVFDLCMYFTQHQDEEVCLKAIMALGFVGVREPTFLLRPSSKALYLEILSPSFTSTRKKCTLLNSLLNHLMEEEEKLQADEGGKKRDRKKKKEEDQGDIKEFGDTHSGATSAVMQALLKSILETFFHMDSAVRLSALQVIRIILRQGLIHPAQCVPYLIASCTDDDQAIRTKSEQSLTEINSRHSGFIHMKAMQGVKLSYRYQKTVNVINGSYIKGYREDENKIALISHIYSMLRATKQYRRPLLQTVLKIFDDSESPIDMLFFLIENLAYLPYGTQEEPLFLMHHIDMYVSVTGAGLLQSFKEILNPPKRNKKKVENTAENEENDDSNKKDEMNESSASEADTPDVKKLEETVRSSFGCMLLLELKHFLKQLYGFADSKCQKYSPSESTKLYDKSLVLKGNKTFETEYNELMFSTEPLTEEQLKEYYFEFKQSLLRLDNEEDSDDAEQAASESKQQATESKQSAQESGTEEKTDTTTAQQPTEENQASDVNQTSGADVAQDSTDTKKVETKEPADTDQKAEESSRPRTRRLRSRRNSLQVLPM